MLKVSSCIACESIMLTELGSLGKLPSCNQFHDGYDDALRAPKFDLDLVQCDNCDLVQLGTHLPFDELFGANYPYFSSLSESWLAHCERAAAKYVTDFKIDAKTSVLEIGSNDGYMLRNFSNCKLAIGVEPSSSAASVALRRGIHTITAFFDAEVADEIYNKFGGFDVIISNNMMAHTPNLKSVLQGAHKLLNDTGVFVIEVQYATKMFAEGIFDTVYHEHYCYYTLKSATKVLKENALYVFDVEFIPTHGGSIRIYAARNYRAVSDRLKISYENEEKELSRYKFYGEFFTKAIETKNAVVKFVEKNGPIVAYGAPTKGNVFMNFCELTDDHVKFTCDASPLKSDRYCPGTGVKVKAPNFDLYRNEDHVLILPWNIKDEIQQNFLKNGCTNCKFMTAIPTLNISD